MKPLKALISKNTIHRAHSGSGGMFSKSSLRCGTIVMFDDDTLGVYVEGILGEYMKNKLRFDDASDKWFITHGRNGKFICFFDLSGLDEELKGDYDVIRIYDERLKDDEIKKFTKKDFYFQILAITNKMTYKERK